MQSSESVAVQVIIAPTRGSNWRMCTAGAPGRCGHHRPYEGQQPDHRAACGAPPRGHHRPYEGQQHDLADPWLCCGWVIIAPTRGSNGKDARDKWMDELVIIAPTRGSNPTIRPMYGG